MLYNVSLGFLISKIFIIIYFNFTITLATKESPMYNVKHLDMGDDDNLIIANKPTVVSGFEGDQGAVIDIKNDKKPANFSTATQSEPPGSTDSSWGSSSECSTISENGVDIVIDPKLKYTGHQSEEIQTTNGKSESNLSDGSVKKKVQNNECSDKAVSLPALELDKEEGSGKNKKPVKRPTNHVGFSLPEIEKPSSSSTESKDLGESSKSDPDKIMALLNNDDESTAGSSSRVMSDLDVAIANSLAQRSIIRQGAFRDSDGSRFGLRARRQRTDSGSPATSLLNQESDGNVAGSSSEGKHYAFTHEDTSPGAVHCFQDVYGWYLLVFGLQVRGDTVDGLLSLRKKEKKKEC